MTSLPTSVKDLKALITKAGLSFTDCIDKSDLMKRAQEAWNRLNGVTSGSGASANSNREVKYGGFDCKIMKTKEGQAKIDGILLIMHGLGVIC